MSGGCGHEVVGEGTLLPVRAPARSRGGGLILQLGADEFIVRLPQGYDTLLGQRGGKLSVGQKQRLSIARALVRRPAVLILDEATSSVDSELEARLEELGETARVPGVDVARSEKILGSLGAQRLLRSNQVRPAPLIALSDLAKVHSDRYLERTAQPEYLGRIFGLEAHDIEVDPVLIAQRRQVGGTVEAAASSAASTGR